MVEQDLGDAVGLFQRSEVPGVGERDRSSAGKESEVGLTLWYARPVVITIDQRQRRADATIEGSGGDHAIHVAVDLARHPRVAATTAHPAQLPQVVVGQLAPIEQTAAQDDAEHGFVLHPRDHRSDRRQTCTADVDGGDAIGSTDALGVVVGVEDDDVAHPPFELALVVRLRGVILVENRETFRHLLALADRDYLVVWVPGGPPPAEVALVRRLAELQPDARFHAVFDLDPAGIRIARLLEERSGVSLAPTGMTPELFARARKHLPWSRWDEAQLERYAGDAAALEPLRAAIAAAGAKVEQETIRRGLYALLDSDA